MDVVEWPMNLRGQVREIVAAMRADPAGAFQTGAAAREAGARPEDLIRAFRQATGVSPLRFRAALRMERAKHALIETDEPVTAIALDCGYDSLGTFTRTFSLMVGLSPNLFRQRAREAPCSDPPWARSAPPGPGPCIAGTVPDPAPGQAMLVALGLFERAVPAGPPIAGQLIPGGGRFVLPDETRPGSRHLLGFAAPPGASLWLPQSAEIRVFGRELARSGDETLLVCDIRWRRPGPTDPPLVLALPAMLAAVDSANPGEARRVQRRH